MVPGNSVSQKYAAKKPGHLPGFSDKTAVLLDLVHRLVRYTNPIFKNAFSRVVYIKGQIKGIFVTGIGEYDLEMIVVEINGAKESIEQPRLEFFALDITIPKHCQASNQVVALDGDNIGLGNGNFAAKLRLL